jgi:hypothetical protein
MIYKLLKKVIFVKDGGDEAQLKYDLACMLPLSIIIFAVSTQLQELSSVDWYEIELKRSQKSGNSGQKAAKKAEK